MIKNPDKCFLKSWVCEQTGKNYETINKAIEAEKIPKTWLGYGHKSDTFEKKYLKRLLTALGFEVNVVRVGGKKKTLLTPSRFVKPGDFLE